MSFAEGADTLKQLSRKSNSYSKRELVIFGIIIFLIYGIITYICFYFRVEVSSSTPKPGALSPELGSLMMALLLGGAVGFLGPVVL